MSLPPAYQPLYDESPCGPFIVLEGVSGIGKTTLTSLLTKRTEASSLHTLAQPHTGWSSAVNAKLRPLPQFAFYLSGVLHASDSLRLTRTLGPVVADRYVFSVIACHAAAHHVDVDHVSRLLEPFRPYLETPTHTFYLHCSEAALRERLAGKPDAKKDDTDLLTVPGRLSQLLENFATVAATDNTAVWVDTDGKTPDNLADWITTYLENDRAQPHRR
ncbi:thymidylate kinase [Streptomyces sp. NPDC102274]|uniref:thymidylate kinase n=1 Tax=Streptomyces sp. NPDC102274 TaxID=3366151 RepID=UPI0037F7BA79